jgi:hypothetical protein
LAGKELKMGVSDHVFWWGIDAYMCNVSLLAFKLLLLQEMQQEQETAVFPRMVCPDFRQIIIPSSTSPLGTDEVSIVDSHGSSSLLFVMKVMMV